MTKNTGYRYYTLDQCSTIDLIQQLADIGMSLSSIKTLLDSKDPQAIEKAVREKIKEIDGKIKHLSYARDNAQALLKSSQLLQRKPLFERIILEHIPDRPVLRFPILNPDAQYLSKNGKAYLQEWELNLRQTKKLLSDKGIPTNLFRRIGCTIELPDLLAHSFKLSSTFIALEEDEDLPELEERDIMPAGTYLTMYCDGYIEENGENKEINGISQVLDYAQKHGLSPVGTYWGEIITESPAFSYYGRDFLFKICIPISLTSQQ